jgi:hypothetical protein
LSREDIVDNKRVGTVLLVTAAACFTFGMVGAKVAFAIEKGMYDMRKGQGPIEPPDLGWAFGVSLAVLAVLGLLFLFRKD